MGIYELPVWVKAMNLVDMIYDLTEKLPDSERWGLVDQMRRAAVSIPSNISEGQARETAKDFQRFLYIARGSKAELKTQLLICERRQFISEEDCNEAIHLLDEVGIILNRTIKKLSEPSDAVKRK